MKKLAWGAMFFLVMLVVFTSTARAEFKEGKWSMTMGIKMENMPPEMAAMMKQIQNMPPETRAAVEQIRAKMGVQINADGEEITVTNCITNQNPVPNYTKDKNMETHCQQTHEINGNSVNFHNACNFNNTQVDASGSMVYAGDSMQGHIKSHTVTRTGKVFDSTIDITGQYVGPC
jgi:hypothetical protein